MLSLVLAFALAADEAGANRFIQSDTFIDTLDGTPDTEKWTVSESGDESSVLIENGELQTKTVGPGYAYCIQEKGFSNDNISLQIDYKAEVIQGRAFELTLSTRNDTSSHIIFQVKFDGQGWSYKRRLNGQTDVFYTSVFTLVQGTWYSCKLEIISDVANFTIKHRSTGSLIVPILNVALDSMLQENWVQFGVMSETSPWNPEAYWDEFHLYDPIADPNTNPRWWTVPTLRAVEDVPYSYDFTPYVSDDQEPWELSISSTSEYVTGADGLTAHFLFPNNVTATAVTLLLTDGNACERPARARCATDGIHIPRGRHGPGLLRLGVGR